MKRITIISALVAVGLASVVSCDKTNVSSVEPFKTVGVTIKGQIASEDTKTYIEESGNVYIPHWASDESDKLGVFFGEIANGGTPITFETLAIENEVATFYGKAELEPGENTVHAFYPAEAFAKSYANQRIGLTVGTTQYPVLGSFDPSCDLLIAKETSVNVEDADNIELENLEFSRIMAVLRVNLVTKDSDAIAAGQEVKQLKLAISGVDDDFALTGRVSVDPDGSIYAWNIKGKEVIAEYDNADHNPDEAIWINEEGGMNAAYFVVNPTTIPAGSQLTFTIKAENNNFVRTVTTPEMVFEAGKVSSINLTIRDKDLAEDVSYAGEWVIGNAEGTVLAGLWANGNNLPGVETTVSDGSILLPSGKTLDDVKVTITKITEGDYSGLYTIQQSSGLYLYAAARNSNQLKAITPADVNCYWDITEANGAWSLIASKSSYRNVMQYNPNNNNPIFSCYATASQQAVALFPLNDVKENTAPTITAGNVKIGPDAVEDADLGAAFNQYVTSVETGIYDDEECENAFTDNWLSVKYENGVVKYTVTENNTGADRKAYVKITATNDAAVSVFAIVTFEQTGEKQGAVVDELTYNVIGVTGTTYAAKTNITSNSDAVYSTQSAGGNNSIQLRSNNNNSGIVTTTSGGKVTKIVVEWNSNSTTGRTLNIYGKNTAYTSPSDLYGNSAGTLLGTIVNGTSTELEIEGDYTYFGVCSASGALYLDKVEITWE